MPKAAPNSSPRLLRLRHAAEYLGRSPKALRAMIRRGELPVVKRADNGHAPWQVDRVDLDRWIEAAKITL